MLSSPVILVLLYTLLCAVSPGDASGQDLLSGACLGLAIVVWLGQCCDWVSSECSSLVPQQVRTDMGRGQVALPVFVQTVKGWVFSVASCVFK